MKKEQRKRIIGAVERVVLQLGDARWTETCLTLRAKIDTGADRSSLHASCLSFERTLHGTRLSFKVGSRKFRLVPTKQVTVRSSNGLAEKRWVIHAKILVGNRILPIRLSLCDRSEMEYPLLLGRSFLRHRFLVEPAGKHLLPPHSPRIMHVGKSRPRHRLLRVAAHYFGRQPASPSSSAR